MKNRTCEKLEAYLAGEFDAPTAATFAAHLAACQACQFVVEQQRWLDELVCDAGTSATASPDLLAGVETRITRARRTRRLAYGLAAFSAAASLLLAFGMQPDRSLAPTPTPNLATNPQPPAKPVATFTGTEDVIVVQHDSPDPNVTIVQVYSTLNAARRRDREAEEILLPALNILRGDPS